MGVTERLAMERTKLAEERTHLAYIRTGLSMLMAGLFFIGYFQIGIYSYVGYGAVLLSVLFLAYGAYNHRKTHEIIDRFTKEVINESGPGKKTRE